MDLFNQQYSEESIEIVFNVCKSYDFTTLNLENGQYHPLVQQELEFFENASHAQKNLDFLTFIKKNYNPTNERPIPGRSDLGNLFNKYSNPEKSPIFNGIGEAFSKWYKGELNFNYNELINEFERIDEKLVTDEEYINTHGLEQWVYMSFVQKEKEIELRKVG